MNSGGNKMNKKKFLGIPIAFVVGLFVMGTASAALLLYLSNTTVINVGVTSTPLVLKTWDGAGYVDTPVTMIPGVIAGSSRTTYFQVENKANNDLVGIYKVVVSNDIVEGVSCGDLSTFMINGISGACAVDTPVIGQVTYTWGGNTFTQTSTISDLPVLLTFSPFVQSANYVITTTLV